MELQKLKNLYKKGMHYAIKKSSWWFPPNKEMCDYQIELAEKAQDLTTLSSVVGFFNHTFASSFPGPKEICSTCLHKNIPFQFGNGPNGWYFISGVCDNIAYCITLLRVELAAPHIIKKTGLEPSECVLWNVVGGYGDVDKKEWITIPFTTIQMKYNKTSFSSFQLENLTVNEIIKYVYFSCDSTTKFTFNISFNDKDGNNHNIKSVLIPRGGPLPNAKNSCLRCDYNLGSLYFSFTNPICIASFNNNEKQTGIGWIDHQTYKAFMPDGLWANLLLTLKRQISGDSKISWTWMYIQDNEDNTQYMISRQFYEDYNKNFVVGYKFTSQICNIYKDGVSYIQDDKCLKNVMIEVMNVKNINNINYPIEYKITLPNNKKVTTKAVFGANTFINSALQDSYEIPGLLYNENGKNIGTGFLEINGMYPKEDYINRFIKLAAHGDQSKKELVKSALYLKQSLSIKLLPWIVIILIVSVIIYSTIYLYKVVKSNKNVM